MCIRDSYWSESTQNIVRDHICYVRYDASRGTTTTACFLGKVCLARNLEPKIPEESLVTKLAYHYEEGIARARLGGQVKTVQSMAALLENYEHEGYFRRSRQKNDRYFDETTRIAIIITIVTMAITGLIIQIEIIIIRNSIIDTIIITTVTVILTIIGQIFQIINSTDQMVKIIKLTDQTTRTITIRTITTRTEHIGGLTTREPRTMVGEGDTTKDARVSAVTQTETMTTMTGGTPGTKQ